MAVRLREADSMAAVAEMRQRIAELEIQVSGRAGVEGGQRGGGPCRDAARPGRPQREEGRIQGQLNHSDSSQYIRELKDQIEELKAEVSAGGARGRAGRRGFGERGRGGPAAGLGPWEGRCPPPARRSRPRCGC